MRVQVDYSPEGGSKRTWFFDAENPPWDLAYVTERETGWPWEEFMEKLSMASYVAMRAFVFAFRKRDEPRLSIESVEVTAAQLNLHEPEPEGEAKPLKAVRGKGEA